VPDPKAARDKLVAWVRANNRYGPDSAMVRDTAQMVDAEVTKVNSLTFTFGKGQTRSGKGYQLIIWAGQFFVFELTDDQLKSLDIDSDTTRVQTGTRHLDRREVAPLVQIERPKLDGGTSLDGKKAVSGEVAFKATKQLPKGLAVRLSYVGPGGTVGQFQYLEKGLPENAATVPFRFKAINSEGDSDDKDIAGPLVLFLDLCTVDDTKDFPEVTILSNTVALLVDVAGETVPPVVARERATLEGHTKAVLAVVFAPDGKTLASAGGDGMVKLWDPCTAKERMTLKGHEMGVRALAFRLDGKVLAWGSFDRTIRVWDPATGQALRTLEGHDKQVLALAFAPDGRTLASGSGDGTVKLWDPSRGEVRTTLKGSEAQL
jgi:WD40 repeat protein